jgi:hypothetical protein
MSFDLYLLPRPDVGRDADIARDFIDSENRQWPRCEITPSAESRVRQLANLILQMQPSYTPIEVDAVAVMALLQRAAPKPSDSYLHIELNGPDDLPNAQHAQFFIHERYVLVQWYSGTTSEEMDALLFALAETGDFVIYDPQVHQVLDLREDSID